jgi:DUF4097 and DUF4098 domain-containing protein YvlB
MSQPATKPRVTPAGRSLAIGGGALLTAGLVAVGGLQMAPALSGNTTTRQDLSFAHVNSIRVDNNVGSVQIVGDSTSGVQVHRTTRTTVSKPRVSSTLSPDGTLQLTGNCATVVFWSSCRVDYVVHVPRTTPVNAVADSGVLEVNAITAPVTLHADSGRVQVSDVDGPVRIDADSGHIEVDRITGPSLMVQADSGRIEGDGIAVADISATADSGSISLGLSKPPNRLSAVVDSGTIDLGVPDVAGGYAVDDHVGTGSRAIEVETNPASHHTIDVRADSGSISVHG